METENKKYKTVTTVESHIESHKERQLSSLFNIISSNLLVATEVLGQEYNTDTVKKLEALSQKAKSLANDLLSNSKNINKADLTEEISNLKRSLLELVIDLNEELRRLQSNKSSNGKALENLILARRLLRESQRGLITIQD